MSGDFIFIILCVLVGAGITVQAAVNASLAKSTGLPSFATLMSFLLGLLPIFIYYTIESKGFSHGNYSNLRWHQFLGGFLGAAYVFVIILSIPKLGAATVLSATIAGQVILGVIMDHYGWLDVTVIPASLGRIVGVMLIVGGAILIKVF